MTAHASASAYRSKTVAGVLALLAGCTGAHRLYLGARWWWIYPLAALPAAGIALRGDPWYRHPAFFFAALVVLATMLEAIVFSLTPDAAWDARRNAGTARRSTSGALPVLVAIVALMSGAILMMTVMAIALEGWFASMRAR